MSGFLYLAYIAFFVYVCWSVRRMDAVHSRLGVTFTALVEIAVSTITSLSVCALVGFRITMVPWSVYYFFSYDLHILTNAARIQGVAPYSNRIRGRGKHVQSGKRSSQFIFLVAGIQAYSFLGRCGGQDLCDALCEATYCRRT